MNTRETNSTTMFKMVAKVLDDHNDVWSGMSPLTVSVQAFKGKIQGIDDAVQQQETPTGATDAKSSGIFMPWKANESCRFLVAVPNFAVFALGYWFCLSTVR